MSLGGRRGRPPLSAKKEKLTRSKSINDDQSTNDSFATSSIAEESISKPIDEKKLVAYLSSDSELMDKSDEKEQKEEESVEPMAVNPPELHDENTLENKITEEESIINVSSPVPIKVELNLEQTPPKKAVISDSDESVSPPVLQRQESEDKKESQTTPVKDAFDFDDEEVLKEEEPLKEQLKKKRKSKDDGKKSNKSINSSSDKNDKTSTSKDKVKDVSNEDNSVKDNGRSNSFSRKSTKKSRKTAAEPPVVEKPVVVEVPPPVAEVLPPPKEPTPKEIPIKVEEEEKPKTTTVTKAVKSLPVSVESAPPKQSEPKHKRKGRKRKDSESVTPVKKKIKPQKLELHEEDSNLEVQKLFESYSSSTPPQESDISPVEEMKVLPQFTTDINPPQMESVSSDFLICEEAVPASPEKAPQHDEHMDDSMPLHESPHSFHSSPTQSPQNMAHKEAKCSGGSNSELENEPIVSAKDSSNKMEMSFPSPTHDEDSMISRPDCNKSPVSPKKRRRGRIRTTSQSEGYPKERIGCKTRGSSGQ